ncbi:uncharacterized protein LOC123307858 [Coccinella septempunctata]|uniref:uncharacterized protein LOC123307858 n=1 Tax=Coccinella septempunctata TaxID=41139 RepID=UPI001D07DBFF|nr:uncharacterized protein LOC123307858 [Coccinella septempunctata]
MMVTYVNFLVFLLTLAVICSAKVGPKVKCFPDKMRVEVPIVPSNTKQVYLEGLKNYPDPACRPHTDSTGNLAVLELDLRDVYRCAVTRVVNEKTGKQIFYQTLVVEGEEKTEDGQSKKTRETIHVKCSILSLRNHTVSRRSVLPAGFQEPEDLEITKTVTEVAPEPILGVGVRQAGKLVTGELNVSPGTPLQMEIFLDKVSAAIYGILVTHMQVTDTKSQEETIIYNGCSVDPYLFENFQTEDGDFLTAKFRAFKFPESTYVQFKGTVNVCLNKCQGVECSDGQIGYGRRRRSLPTLPADPNKIFEITITSFIKVNYDDESENFEALIKNQTKIFEKGSVSKLQTRNMEDRRFYETVQNQEQAENTPLLIQKEQEQYITVTDHLSDSAVSTLGNVVAVLICPALLLLRI